MTVFAWNESLSVHIQEIDLQHMRLVSLLADLDAAHAAGAEREIMARVIRELNDYVRDHFTAEERLMAKYAFPGLEAHVALHAFFTEKLLHFELDYLGGRADISDDLLEFLGKWFHEHVQGADQLYAAFVLKQGLV